MAHGEQQRKPTPCARKVRHAIGDNTASQNTCYSAKPRPGGVANEPESRNAQRMRNRELI